MHYVLYCQRSLSTFHAKHKGRLDVQVGKYSFLLVSVSSSVWWVNAHLVDQMHCALAVQSLEVRAVCREAASTFPLVGATREATLQRSCPGPAPADRAAGWAGQVSHDERLIELCADELWHVERRSGDRREQLRWLPIVARQGCCARCVCIAVHAILWRSRSPRVP